MLSSQSIPSFWLSELVAAESKLFKWPVFLIHCFFKGITYNLECWVIFWIYLLHYGKTGLCYNYKQIVMYI